MTLDDPAEDVFPLLLVETKIRSPTLKAYGSVKHVAPVMKKVSSPLFGANRLLATRRQTGKLESSLNCKGSKVDFGLL